MSPPPPDPAAETKADGLFVGTFHNPMGVGLLDHYEIKDARRLVEKWHDRGPVPCPGRKMVGTALNTFRIPRPLLPGSDTVCPAAHANVQASWSSST